MLALRLVRVFQGVSSRRLFPVDRFKSGRWGRGVVVSKSGGIKLLLCCSRIMGWKWLATTAIGFYREMRIITLRKNPFLSFTNPGIACHGCQHRAPPVLGLRLSWFGETIGKILLLAFVFFKWQLLAAAWRLGGLEIAEAQLEQGAEFR